MSPIFSRCSCTDLTSAPSAATVPFQSPYCVEALKDSIRPPKQIPTIRYRVLSEKRVHTRRLLALRASAAGLRPLLPRRGKRREPRRKGLLRKGHPPPRR